MQEYFTGAFREIETSGGYKSPSPFVTTHQKKKLYASLVLKNLHIQLYHSSVDIVRLKTDDPNTCEAVKIKCTI